jgi:hypothetical protein
MKSTSLSMKADYLFEILHKNQGITIKLKAYIRLCEISLYYDEKKSPNSRYFWPKSS